MNELQEKMIHFRAEHNLSQTDFAKKCKLSTQTVMSIEKGQQNPSRITYAKIMIVINGGEIK